MASKPIIAAFVTALGIWICSCGSSSSTNANAKAQGDEGGACYPNGTCNASLSCLSNLCVKAGTTTGNTDAGGTQGSVDGGGGDNGQDGGGVTPPSCQGGAPGVPCPPPYAVCTLPDQACGSDSVCKTIDTLSSPLCTYVITSSSQACSDVQGFTADSHILKAGGVRVCLITCTSGGACPTGTHCESRVDYGVGVPPGGTPPTVMVCVP